MTEERLPSKFAFILHADIAESTALVQQDEDLAHKRIQDTFRRFGDIIKKYHGQVRELRGDALLAEFERASDAVTAALGFQADQSEFLAQLDEPILPKVRMGIAMGEVIVADETLTGAGVVLAQRMEQLAEPGGVCITGAIHEALPPRLPFDQGDLGEQQVKGFDEPVRVYTVRLKGGGDLPEPTVISVPRKSKVAQFALVATVVIFICGGGLLAWMQPWKPDFEPASVDKMAFPLPDKPSIAVLPFDNFSGEGKDDFIAKGLTEDIITALSKLPQFFVISRTSSFAFKGKDLPVTEIAEALGVRYILEGSVQRSSDKLRINAQLVDALKGHHLWAENFDGSTEDLFSLQDDLVRRILIELDVKLTAGDNARVGSRGTTNLDAWLLREQGKAELYKFNREGTIRTRQLMQQAHEADPNWSRPVGTLAWAYWYEAKRGWADDREEWIRKGVELAEKAIEMDPEDTLGYMQLGNLHQLMGDHERAIELRQKAVEIAPNDFQANWGLGVVLTKAGETERAVEVFKHAERVSPRHPASFMWAFSSVLLYAGQYEEAIEVARRVIKRTPDRTFPRIRLTAAYAALGRTVEAQNEATEVLRIDPKFTVSKWKDEQVDFKDRAAVDKVASLLIEAGLPENSPLELPDKPSIAVLPFTNMSGDPEQEYFADGITEDLITELSRFKNLFVISRTSSFAYKNKNVKVQDIGRELGVRYLLEGSVRKSGKDLRITAQLIEVQTGRHIWAEKYDRQVDDVFAIQDDINGAIVTTLGETLWQAAAQEVARKPPSSFEAYDYHLRAMDALHHLTKDNNLVARELFELARERDPEFAAPYRGLAWTYLLDFITQWVTAGEEVLDRALDYTNTANAFEADSAGGHRLLGRISQARGNYDEALSQFERALELNPNDGDILASYGSALVYSGRSAEGIKWAKEAIRRNPHHPDWYTTVMALGHYFNGEYGDTLQLLNRIERPRMWDHRLFAAAYAQTGNLTEAKKHVAAMLAINPKTSITSIKPAAAFKKPADVNRYLEGLRKAGLPE